MAHKTFVDRCLDGESVAADIDDAVDSWHDGDSFCELHEYLGLTFTEYAAWVEHPDLIEVILLTKKYGIPFDEAMSAYRGREHQVG